MLTNIGPVLTDISPVLANISRVPGAPRRAGGGSTLDLPGKNVYIAPANLKRKQL
jgi:hypothetical protein